MIDIPRPRQPLAAACGPLAAAFVVVASANLWTGSRVQDAAMANQRTHVILEEATRLVGAAVDMQAASRGFLLSGAEAHLEPWTQGRTAADGHLARLKHLSADALQVRRLEALTATHRDFRNAAEAQIQLRRDVPAGQSLDAVLGEFNTGRDQSALDRFRGVASEFITAEDDLMFARTAQQEALRTANFATGLGGVVLALALSLALWLRRRTSAEALRVRTALHRTA